MNTDGLKRVALMPPENGNKMLELGEHIEGELENYIRNHTGKSEAELISRANTVLYDLAQKRGISLWKLCFEVMPKWEMSEAKLDKSDDCNVMFNIDYDLHLVPIQIDWQHGPGYWEKKYNDLRERVADLLDEKDD